MARSRRLFAPATSYHVTMRCNNQAFDLRLSRDGGWDQAGLFAVVARYLYMKGIS
jgi:REP element-mobilizing transposase RayT